MITSALEDLQKKDLKKFKLKLCDRQEEPRVTRRSVEEADEMDLADLLVKICTEAKAAQQTIDLFTELGFSDQAEKFRKGKTATVTKKTTVVGLILTISILYADVKTYISYKLVNTNAQCSRFPTSKHI